MAECFPHQKQVRSPLPEVRCEGMPQHVRIKILDPCLFSKLLNYTESMTSAQSFPVFIEEKEFYGKSLDILSHKSPELFEARFIFPIGSLRYLNI